MSITRYIEQAKQPLSKDSMIKAMTIIMNGQAEHDDIAAFLTVLADRGATAEEISGAAHVLRSKVDIIKAPKDAVDCCGTGGDGTCTYNISTAVAMVVAAYGIPMAKHGNRSASSKCGAADVLEALDVKLEVSKASLEKALQDMNFCFLMAPQHHKAMKYVAQVRKELGFRTIFNLLGPLANPANTKLQLIGVYDRKWLTPMAEALSKLGTERAWLVHGYDGMDEITLTDKTDITILRNGIITNQTVSPDDFGLPYCTLDDLRGGDAAFNAKALKAIFEGQQNAYRNIVLANAAAVIAIHEDRNIEDLPNLVTKAAAVIDSGQALNKLNDYIAFTNKE